MDLKRYDTQKATSIELQEAIHRINSPYISNEHSDFLLKRHGTLELNPLPSAHEEDPYNWPRWKVGTLHSGGYSTRIAV